jgi:crotonobetainyl-CoA:carnitine CoA-transferase CaiB-like acyl-CoA transferase
MQTGQPMLTGYRVLDLTQFVAGPTCGRILAELGAEVIKIELAPLGDRSRTQGVKPKDPAYQGSSQSSYYVQHNHSKRSLALDFKHAGGRKLIRELVAKSDVLVENFAPGVMARAGLSYDELKAINPRLVMCSISFAGQSGPLSDKPGYDYVAQAYAGVTDLIGEPGQSPVMVPMAIGDVSTGVAAAMAIGFALLHRERTGEGQHIESTLLDTYFHMHEANVPRIALRGGTYVPKRTGSQHPDGGPAGVFHYRDDQYITIVALPHQWSQVLKVLGRPELADDPRFATARDRRANNKALQAIIEDWLRQFPSREAALAALEKERVPCAPVLTVNEVVELAHLRERGSVRRVREPQIGEFDIPGIPARFSRWPVALEVKADLLGEQNDAVLRDVLGLSDAEIAALYADEVLVRDPLCDQQLKRA